jgi:hypothetical protein
MKEIWNRRERIEKERRGIGKNVNFYSKCELLEENFHHLLQNLKWPRFLPTITNFPGTLSITLLITFFQFHPTFQLVLIPYFHPTSCNLLVNSAQKSSIGRALVTSGKVFGQVKCYFELTSWSLLLPVVK